MKKNPYITLHITYTIEPVPIKEGGGKRGGDAKKNT